MDETEIEFDDELSGRIIQCFLRVHHKLGGGLKEQIYQNALLVDFKRLGISYECEKYVDVIYEGINVGTQRLDLVVENKVIVELKVVEKLHKSHYGQLRSYLRAANLELGLLVNFAHEKVDFRRVDVPKRNHGR